MEFNISEFDSSWEFIAKIAEYEHLIPKRLKKLAQEMAASKSLILDSLKDPECELSEIELYKCICYAVVTFYLHGKQHAADGVYPDIIITNGNRIIQAMHADTDGMLQQYGQQIDEVRKKNPIVARIELKLYEKKYEFKSDDDFDESWDVITGRINAHMQSYAELGKQESCPADEVKAVAWKMAQFRDDWIECCPDELRAIALEMVTEFLSRGINFTPNERKLTNFQLGDCICLAVIMFYLNQLEWEYAYITNIIVKPYRHHANIIVVAMLTDAFNLAKYEKRIIDLVRGGPLPPGGFEGGKKLKKGKSRRQSRRQSRQSRQSRRQGRRQGRSRRRK